MKSPSERRGKNKSASIVMQTPAKEPTTNGRPEPPILNEAPPEKSVSLTASQPPDDYAYIKKISDLLAENTKLQKDLEHMKKG